MVSPVSLKDRIGEIPSVPSYVNDSISSGGFKFSEIYFMLFVGILFLLILIFVIYKFRKRKSIGDKMKFEQMLFMGRELLRKNDLDGARDVYAKLKDYAEGNKDSFFRDKALEFYREYMSFINVKN